MVFFIAIVSILALVAIHSLPSKTPEHFVSRRRAAIRTAKILRPYFAVLAIVSTFFAILSFPIARANLNDSSIDVLRALEEEVVSKIENSEGPAKVSMQPGRVFQSHLTAIAGRYRVQSQDEFWMERSKLLSVSEDLARFPWPSRQVDPRETFKPVPDASVDFEVFLDPHRLSPHQIEFLEWRLTKQDAQQREQRQELLKELAAGAMEQFTNLVEDDPIAVFFYEAFAATATDAISRLLSKQLMEPALQRITNQVGNNAVDPAGAEAKAIVSQVNVSSHWKRFESRFGGGIERASNTFANATSHIKQSMLASAANKDREDTPLTIDERVRLVGLLKQTGLSETASTLENLYLAASRSQSNDAAVIQWDAMNAERYAFSSLCDFLGTGPRANPKYFRNQFYKDFSETARSTEAEKEVPIGMKFKDRSSGLPAHSEPRLIRRR